MHLATAQKTPTTTRRSCVNFTCDYSAIWSQQRGPDREATVRTVCRVPGLQALRNQLFD